MEIVIGSRKYNTNEYVMTTKRDCRHNVTTNDHSKKANKSQVKCRQQLENNKVVPEKTRTKKEKQGLVKSKRTNNTTAPSP